MINRKQHWENVFANKNSNEVSWTQAYPTISMQFIEEINLPKNAHIIEVGGGESFFVDALLEKGFTNITVLDISENALEKAKLRLGKKANFITWIVADITNFESNNTFDFWHDRAVFHFLTDQKEVATYKQIVDQLITQNGYFLLGTFSPIGPLKCSGLDIVQYNESDMKATFAPSFEMIKSYQQQHQTPFNTIQNFQFGGFIKTKN
jgi:SAM-dependent methyltransferase